jgi:hypothetical protein
MPINLALRVPARLYSTKRLVSGEPSTRSYEGNATKRPLNVLVVPRHDTHHFPSIPVITSARASLFQPASGSRGSRLLPERRPTHQHDERSGRYTLSTAITTEITPITRAKYRCEQVPNKSVYLRSDVQMLRIAETDGNIMRLLQLPVVNVEGPAQSVK